MNYLTESKHNTIPVTEVYSPPYCECLPAQERQGEQVEAVCGGGVVRAELVRVRGPYCFCVTLCLAAAQCTTAAALRSCASTGHHTHHTHSWSRDAGDPTVSTPATVTFIVRIAQLLPLRMKELLNSKPPALHLERPLGPMLPCPAAAWPE